MHPDTIEGKEGWLFLRDGNNYAMDKLTGKVLLTKQQIMNWILEIARRKQHACQYNYTYKYLIVPDKQCVYPEYMPQNFKLANSRPASQLVANMPDVIIYLLPFLLSEKSVELYYKTDTHWNQLGAVTTLNKYMQKLCDTTVQFSVTDMTMIGDLGKRYSPPRDSHSKSIVINGKYNKIFDNGITNTGRIIITESDKYDAPIGIVFGDSMFTNVNHILSQYFQKLYYFHSSCFDYHIIESIKPDIVLNENVERFISSVNIASFNEIFINKLLQLKYADKEEMRKFAYACDIDLGINTKLIEDYINSAAPITNDADFESNKYNFINDNSLLYALPRPNRLATRGGWEGNEQTKFSGWGAGYFHDSDSSPLGLAMHLKNITDNSIFIINVYKILRNCDSYDTQNMPLIDSLTIPAGNLYIYSDIQEVFFPLPNLFLERGQAYLFTVEGDAFLGCASASSDMHPQNFLFRGYFKFQGDSKFRSIVSSQSIAWRFIFPTNDAQETARLLHD